MGTKAKAEILDVGGREVRISNPEKVYFPAAGITKLDLVHYYMAVGEGALRGIYNRPIVLKRYVHGVEGEGFFQKRAPAKRPDWVHTVELSFPSGRKAHELVVTELGQLAWMTNLGNIDLNAHPVRADDLEHPDELRVDLDPGPGVGWDTVRQVALVVHQVLAEQGLVGFAIWFGMLWAFMRRLRRMRDPTAIATWNQGTGGLFDLRCLSLALELSMVGYLVGALFYNLTYRHWYFTLLALGFMLSEITRRVSEDGASDQENDVAESPAS